MRAFPVRCEEAEKIIGSVPEGGCCSSCHSDEDEGFAGLPGGSLEKYKGREWEVCCGMWIAVMKWLYKQSDDKSSTKERKMDNFPRRNQMDKWTKEETAIASAISLVESLPADPRLTDCVIKLQEAMSSLADFIDGVPRKEQ